MIHIFAVFLSLTGPVATRQSETGFATMADCAAQLATDAPAFDAAALELSQELGVPSRAHVFCAPVKTGVAA